MQIQYFKPRADIRSYVSSYYSVMLDEPLADIMRAEIASVRFLVRGEISIDLHDQRQSLAAKAAILCGPTHRATKVEFDKKVHVFGAAITPLGWARIFDVGANELADRVVPFLPFVGDSHATLVKRILNAPDDNTRVTVCDHLFAAVVDLDRSINQPFVEEVTKWIVAPGDRQLDDLLGRTGLSARQIERLCNHYFGCPPRMLHRKFRALDSANRLSWDDHKDWRKAGGDYYHDQPHFSREFKHFIGHTPSEFIKNSDLLLRATLKERLEIEHASPLSLIG